MEDEKLDLDEITPSLFEVLGLLEPYGAGNHLPTFAARGVRLVAPPKILKDKHVKLKLKAANQVGGQQFCPDPGKENRDQENPGQEELIAAAILATPRCHPDGAAIGRSERAAADSE